MPFVVAPENTFAAGVAASVAPWGADPDSDWQKYVTTISEMFETVWDIAAPSGNPTSNDYIAGWGRLLDVDLCPTEFLPYLSMFNGTGVTPGTDDATARSKIAAEAGMQRGQPAAMLAAAVRNLTGTQFSVMRERTAANGSADAYHVIMGFRTSECPDQRALIAAVEAIKPGGIQITYVFSDGWTWNEAIHAWSADTMPWSATTTLQP